MNRRRTDGDETWTRLLSWTKSQKSSERLTSHILRADGYKSIDPSHPLGGQDELKDFITIKDNIKWIGAAYFPRGQKSFSEIKDKFKNDLKGVEANKVSGMVFVTNQELNLGERRELKKLGKPNTIGIYHLERIANILDTPENYGIRLEFLDIELTREEQSKVDPKIWKGALQAEKMLEEKYGIENLGPHGDFEWGMLNGKLSALRWVVGFEWDMLDT